jgi:hypothetical protein
VELEGVPLPLGAGTHVVQVVDEGARRGLRETDGGLAGDVVAAVDSSKFFHLVFRRGELALDLPVERARDVARLNFGDVEAVVREEVRLRSRDRVDVLVYSSKSFSTSSLFAHASIAARGQLFFSSVARALSVTRNGASRSWRLRDAKSCDFARRRSTSADVSGVRFSTRRYLTGGGLGSPADVRRNDGIDD